MKITLFLNDQNKTFTKLFVSARWMRKALELRKDMNLNNLSVDDVDAAIHFVAELFDNQFTVDDVYDGVAYDELITKVFDGVFMYVLQGRKQPDSEDAGNEKKD